MDNRELNMLREIHEAIVGSIDGKKIGFNARVNSLECFKATFQKWLGVVISMAITNVGVLGTQLFLIYLKAKGN